MVRQNTTEKPDPDPADTSNPTDLDSNGDDSAAGTVDAGAEKASDAKPTKPKSRAQVAREKAAEAEKARQDGILETSPLWQVIYPTGISLYRPDLDEVVLDVNGADAYIDVIDGHVHAPMNAKVRAGSLSELTAFAGLAGQGMLRQVLDPGPAH